MLSNSNKSGKQGTAKKILRAALAASLLLVALWIVFVLTSPFLRRTALKQIAELTNTNVQAEIIDLDLNGRIRIEELTIKPKQAKKYDNTILKAEIVNARFTTLSLLLLRPKLKQIHVRNFTFNAQYDLDSGKWNLVPLKIDPSKGPAKKMPPIKLENGILQYSKVSAGQTKIIAEIPLNAELTPLEYPKDICSFYIITAERLGLTGRSILTGSWKPGTVTITGDISSADIPAFERTWRIDVLAAELKYEPDGNYSLKLRINDLFGTHTPASDVFDKPAFFEKFNAAIVLQKFFYRYQPEGQIDIRLDASGNLKSLDQSNFQGTIYCKNASITDRNFPYPMDHIVGTIGFDEKSLTLNDLNGEHKNVKLSFAGQVKNFGPNWNCDIQMTSKNMALDSDLYGALTQNQKKDWLNFSPAGTAAIKYSFIQKNESDKKILLDVDLLEIESKCRYFPYPLKNLTGRLSFDHDSITLKNLISKDQHKNIKINGKVTNRRSERPVYDIDIIANDIPLDSTLADAMPPQQKQLFQRFNISGFADADLKVFTPTDSTDPTTFKANVSLKNASLNENNLPLIISDISAKTIITPDLIKIENLTGQHSQGLVSISGWISPAEENKQLRYELSINAKQARLNDDLLNLMPASFKKITSELNPQGKINYTTNLQKHADRQPSEQNIIVECLDASLNLPYFRHPLKNVTGTLKITKNALEPNNITADIFDNDNQTPIVSNLKINGKITMAENILSTGYLDLHAENFWIGKKSLTNIKTYFDYDPEKKTWTTKKMVADCYGGYITGKCELKQLIDRPSAYWLQVGFENIDLRQFLAEPKNIEQIKTEPTDQDNYSTGKINGSLGLAAELDENSPKIGRLRLKITDMQVGKLSPLAKLLQVLQLNEPKDYAFDQMLIDSYIKNNKLFIEKFDLSGQTVAFKGSGTIDLQTDMVDLLLTARGKRPATDEPSIWQSLTESLGTAVVKMEVSGYLYNPKITTTTLSIIKKDFKLLGIENQQSE